MLSQVIANQAQSTKGFNARVDGIYAELNGKFESMTFHIKKAETQVAQTVDTVKRQNKVLPGKVEENPKSYYNAIEEVLTPHPYLILDDESLSSDLDGEIQINNLGSGENKANKPRAPLKLLLKEGDPGQFLFSCKIEGYKFLNSLYD